MKCFRRCFCALLCFLLLFGVYSLDANAFYSQDYVIKHQSTAYNVWTGEFRSVTQEVFANDGSNQTETNTFNWQVGDTARNFELISQFNFNNNDGNAVIFLEKGHTGNIFLNDIYHGFKIQIGGWEHWQDTYNEIIVRVNYDTGDYEYIENFNVKKSDYFLFDLDFDIEAKHNIIGVYVQTKTRHTLNGNVNITCHAGEQFGSKMSISVEDYDPLVEENKKSNGFLSSILDWIKGIFTAIGDGFSNIGRWLNDIWESIVNLPANIWNYIKNGFIDLFIPDDLAIQEIKEEMNAELIDKLGVLYQVGSIVYDVFERIDYSDTTNSVSIPSVTIPLGDDSFTFGGYEVQIVPQGFEWLATSIKTLIGMTCSILFVNGLRKRYDEFTSR